MISWQVHSARRQTLIKCFCSLLLLSSPFFLLCLPLVHICSKNYAAISSVDIYLCLLINVINAWIDDMHTVFELESFLLSIATCMWYFYQIYFKTLVTLIEIKRKVHLKIRFLVALLFLNLSFHSWFLAQNVSYLHFVFSDIEITLAFLYLTSKVDLYLSRNTLCKLWQKKTG